MRSTHAGGSRALLATAASLALAAACRNAAQPAPHATASPGERPDSGSLESAPRHEHALDAAVDAGTTPVAAVEGPPPRWGKLPESSGELFGALDGECTHLGVAVLGSETFVHFSPSGKKAVLGRVTEDGLAFDPAFTKGLENGYNVNELTGRWPDQVYLVNDNGGRCSYLNLPLRYDGSKWTKAFALPERMGIEHVQAYLGGAIGLRQCPGCGQPNDAACVDGVFMGDNAKAPPITGDGFKARVFEVTSTGDVFAIGNVCPKSGAACSTQFRWWSPGGTVGYATLGSEADTGNGTLFVRSKTEVYVATSLALSLFDGTKLTPLPAPGKRTNRVLGAAKDGSLWFDADARLWRRLADGTYDDVSPPGFTSGDPVEGLAQGAPWAISKHVLYKHIAASWHKVELPRPPFSSIARRDLTPQSVTVRSPEDVFVVASYFEGQPGWKYGEDRRTLLRTRRPKETMRCDAGKGFESWPPPATETCTTPFVLLSAVSAESPKDFDYPKTRALLAPKVALVPDGTIAEIRENGRTWNGVVPRTFADGRALAELYARAFPMTKPEVVCAQPTITRAIPIAPRK